MIKANELRIGNWVKRVGVDAEASEVYSLWNKGANFVIAHKSDWSEVHTQGCNENGMQGVPLTKEWLLKFGFKETELYMFKDHFYVYKTFDIDSLTDDYAFFEYKFNHSSTLITYVHQLQNLYFALTGKELI